MVPKGHVFRPALERFWDKVQKRKHTAGYQPICD